MKNQQRYFPYKRNCGKYVVWLEKNQEKQIGESENKANFVASDRDDYAF